MTEPCFECGGDADQRHHVVPRSLGGTKTVPLCHVCHGKAHGRTNGFRDTNRLTKVALRAKRDRGELVGGTPLGWQIAADGKSLEPCPRERELIARAKALRAGGMKLGEIARAFAAEGVTTRTGHAPHRKGLPVTDRPPAILREDLPGAVEFGLRFDGRGTVDGATWHYLRGAGWLIATPEIPPETLSRPEDHAETQAALGAHVAEPLLMSTASGANILNLFHDVLAQSVAHGLSACPMRVDGAPFDMLSLALVILHLARIGESDPVRMERVGDTLRIDAPSCRLVAWALPLGTKVYGELAFEPEGLPS